MARRHTPPTKRASTSDLPPSVTRQLETAGGSAFAWYDAELENHLDPRKVWRRWSVAVSLVLDVMLLGVIAAAAYMLGGGWDVALMVAVLVVGAVVGNWWKLRDALRGVAASPAAVLGPLERLPWWTWVGMGAAATHTVLAEEGLVLSIVAVAAMWWMGRPRVRGLLMAVVVAVASVVCVVAEQGMDEGAGWVCNGVVLAVTATAIYVSGVRSLPHPLRRMQASDLQPFIPPPPSRLPWLLAAAPSTRDRATDAPDHIRRKILGAVGERRMGVLLLLLARGRGTRILHDVILDGADEANIDHLVLSRAGVFMIDSKVFGSKDRPGEIVYDTAGNVVHRTPGPGGDRNIESSMSTALWAQDSIQKALGVPTIPVLAVFNAAVTPDMTIQRRGQTVRVVSAWDILEMIDQAPVVLNKARMAQLRMLLPRMRSIVTREPAPVIRPKGATAKASALVAQHSRAARLDRWVSSPEARPAPTQPTVHADVQPTPADAVKATAPVPAPPVPEVVAPAGAALSVAEQIQERWSHMALSEPAAPDDTPAELVGVGRGDTVVLIDFSGTSPAVAMSGPCQGVSGTYLWYCSPEQYRIFRGTGKPVNVATISTKKVARAGK